MLTLSLCSLTTLAWALASSSSPAAPSIVWPALAMGAAAVSAWLYLLLSRARQQMVSSQDGRAVLERLHEARDKHLAGEMNALKAVLRDAKQELGAQRKKNHTGQKELQAAQKALRDEVNRREAVHNERPAFAAIKPKPAVEARPKAVATPAAAAPAVFAEPAQSADSLALQAQLETLKRQHTALAAVHEQTKQSLQTQKQSTQRLQRRHEDLRRIDIISRSKLELLEDKLRGMGRQYYEAISELALLRGEVAPPKPKGLPKAPSTLNGDPMTPEMNHPTQNSLRPHTLMAEGEDEDAQDEDHDSADAPTILDDLDSEGESEDSLPIPTDFAGQTQPGAQ